MQSYQNVSNSQLIVVIYFLYISCKRLCKVIKMLAIHNYFVVFITANVVANAYAKLSKCQQFTTMVTIYNNRISLQTLMQSYQNVSNSQLLSYNFPLQQRCKRFCKVIKMLAIHNMIALRKALWKVANAFAKLSKCQQFTTKMVQRLFIILLQTLLQSYQNVSNSQLRRFYQSLDCCCKRFCKVIKMLAIHNYIFYHNNSILVANAFAKLSKCQQFTTLLAFSFSNILLQTLLQSYQNVSNSQHNAFMIFMFICCKRFCKVIKMLAIHNTAADIHVLHRVANAFAKLSKCQQFTTSKCLTLTLYLLQTLLQSYQNVSNSQLMDTAGCKALGCKRFCKVIKMLAIHNTVGGH